MSSKPTGLAAFARKPKTNQSVGDSEHQAMPTARTRGKAESVALTVRLTRRQWERLHQLALAEGVSLQRLMVDGLGTLFHQRGLPEL